ncbi:hypothetical protein ACMSEF_23315 [Bacteroides thetaiotaomicron]|jgi:hypothetical protein|uniref:hypothetical protein n=1 Tax=Bacteroides thetaiotaomicron TaxID=818 RepID=UPI00232D82B3|nr:hypothetical protein [Bacteroides thetaiotaomicron]MDC2196039.1 hypothetical protein [Bacteroides thetaiotaomicron]
MRNTALLITLCLFCLTANATGEKPRIVNIINFIRQVEPRSAEITEDVLYETVHEQVKLLTKYKLTGTFLLQYDALINQRYQELLKKETERGTEVGAWWEITQPHVEAAGLKWRGRYSWDWHADVGFATGYSPEEREKLVDVYMEKFKSIFGKYPASVGSWFIDAHSLGYMYDKYGITASCNCKDQVGTDGYTLWGGYWNQAYYPSRLNGYMPAQTAKGQIPVPVFRMLGSDPIYQYDTGVGHTIQGVITLEPVYGDAGGSEKWVRHFFKSIFEDPCLGFNYTQAGQENSFTWDAMRKGLEMQIPILAALQEQGKIRIETLETSGKWFKKKYPLTPATSVTTLTDTYDQGQKTVWFNSRYYRANLLWEKNTIRFRDIHLFDENMESDYLTQAGTSSQCVYTTCPIMDGFRWSAPNDLAAIRLYTLNADNRPEEIMLDTMLVKVIGNKATEIICRTKANLEYTFILSEKQIEVKSNDPGRWMLKLNVAHGKVLPLNVENKRILKSQMKDISYGILCKKGTMAHKENHILFIPQKNRIVMDCSDRKIQ